MNVVQTFINRLFTRNISNEVHQLPEIANISSNDTSKLNLADDAKEISLKVAGGERQTVPDFTRGYSAYFDDGLKGILVSNEVPKEYLRALNFLVRWKGDFSNALENVRSIGNTPYSITFDDAYSSKVDDVKISELRRSVKECYLGGDTALRSDLLTQVVVYGCISAEIVVRPNMKGIQKVILVKPDSIEFVYDQQKLEYAPYQRPTSTIIEQTRGVGELIKLNPLTYKYIPIMRMDSTPYATPPFLAALEGLELEDGLMSSFKYIIKKMGILGFLQILVNKPERLPSETSEDYQARAAEFLTKYVVPELHKSMSTGMVAGFKDTHEIQITGNNTNVSGAREMLDMSTEIKMSGLKQDPRFLGRSFSTTETYGEVLLKKFAAQIKSYQRVVDEFMAYVYRMHLVLAGEPVNYVLVESDAPAVENEKTANEAYQVKLANLQMLYNQGIISQKQFAQEAGYDAPFSPIPITSSQQAPPASQNSQQSNYFERYGGSAAPFDYDPHSGEACQCHTHKHEVISLEDVTEESEAYLKYIANYYKAMQKHYKKASDRLAELVGNELVKLNVGATEEEVFDNIVSTLYLNWGAEFTSGNLAIISKWVNQVHKFFRSDITGLGNISFDPANPPEAIFGVRDFRTIEFYKKVDDFYMGKFITDEDTRKRLYEWVRDRVVNDSLPIGKDPATLKIFMREFSGLLQLEGWKIQRIITTSVNRMRANAAVMYMNDAGVSTYEVVGVNDNKQCDWCREMQGKTFSVINRLLAIDALASQSVEDLPTLAPFLVRSKTPEEVKLLTGAQLQRLGFDSPPFHPNCRDTLVAIL